MNKANILAIAFIFLVTCLIFFKIFVKGLYPIPADLLVSFYFPWYSGAWEGYNPWTTHKELLGADAIRQIYLWKEFAMEQFKAGNIPLWNPYTFSGQPLLANFQSSVYYPLNVFYFLTDPRNSWILLIVLQPFLGGIFMYLAARSFHISTIASSFAAIAFMFSSYLITWMENGNIAHSYLWLPLAFWSINEYFKRPFFRYIFVLILALSLSVLAGHPQTAIYIYLASAFFWIYKAPLQGKSFFISIIKYLAIVVLTLLISAIQIFPTADFYKNSPISLPFSKEVFERSILPYKNLITFFGSDFFGHPANNNFWSQSYGDFTPYFGTVPLVFSLWAIYKFRKEKLVKFFTIISALFILSSVHGPITWAIKTFQIPLLDSTTPSRFTSISIFLLIILAGFGFEDIIKNLKNSKYLQQFFIFLIPIGTIYFLMWTFAILGNNFLSPQDIWQTNLAVTRRNLILPTSMFLSIPLGIITLQILKDRFKLKEDKLKKLFIVGIFSVVLVGGIYYTNKFLPVAPKKFIFPDHLLFNWLQNNAGIDRFYGGGTAHIDFNFPTHYKVYGAEGYDTLRYQRYAEFLTSSFTGKVPQSYLRSDGVFPSEENGYRKRLFELLGVKYLLDKEDNPKTGADWHYERFAGDDVEGFWQEGKFQVYKRRAVLPRIFLTTKFVVAKNDQEIIQKIYDPKFDLETLILEQEPSINITNNSSSINIPQLVKYEPNEIIIRSEIDYNHLLFLSDVHDPDWNVLIDGQKSQLLRAHYAFRAVAVPAGNHQVTMNYQPKSFVQGFAISLSSTAGLIMLSIYLVRKRKF